MAVRSRIGKKAIFFTLSSILIVSLFLLYYSTRDDLGIKQRFEIEGSRVGSVNNFAENFEDIYLPRALYATTNKAITEMIEYMIDNQRYIDMNVSFPQAVINGTIYDPDGDPTDLDYPNFTLPGMTENGVDYRLSAWLGELTNISREEMNIITEINISDITIDQSDPWAFNVTAYIDYNISSPRIVGIVGRNVEVSARVPIEGFVDPLIAIETAKSAGAGNEIRRRINRSIINLENDQGSTVVFQIFNAGTYVFQNKSAPSFLMRFEKNLNRSDCCGIESLITEDIWLVSPEQGQRSYTDFQYWMEGDELLCLEDIEEYEDELINITTVPISTDTFPFKFDQIHMDVIYGAAWHDFYNREHLPCRLI